MRTFSISGCLLASAMVLAGCGGQPSRISLPTIDAKGAEKAIGQFDTNGDGVLDEGEIEKAPSLKASLARIDLDGDRKIDASEINARITAWRDSKVGLMPVMIRLNSGGNPIAGADVTLVPEAFLGDAIKTARGTTDQNGMAVMQISDQPDQRGVHPGFYRIEVSKKPSGSETIPSRYNTETGLGLEVEPASPTSRDASFNLSL